MNCLWSISVIFTLLALEVRTYYAIPVEMATGKFNYVENNQCQTFSKASQFMFGEFKHRIIF